MFKTVVITLTCNTITQSFSFFSLTLRKLRQTVARLLVTFVPDLDLQQVNYDCNVIDEILTQVVDEISPPEAAST